MWWGKEIMSPGDLQGSWGEFGPNLLTALTRKTQNPSMILILNTKTEKLLACLAEEPLYSISLYS